MALHAVDTEAPVHELVAVLHKYKIPIALLDKVFENVKKDINIWTIPYNPNAECTIPLATSAATEAPKVQPKD